MITGFLPRRAWAARRRDMELGPEKKGLIESRVIRLDTVAKWAYQLFQLTPFHARGFSNAACPRLVAQDLVIPRLPPEFDGYTILHLTDLHLNVIPELAGRTARLIRELHRKIRPDLCLFTGDYRDSRGSGTFKDIMAPMKEILCAMHPGDGIYGVLGNHDTWEMAEPFEAMGLRMLINETCLIRRRDQVLALTGLDDPNRYLTPEAARAMEDVRADVKVALIHSPELYEAAAMNGYDFYLTGHTHAGQISLPGGRPLTLPLEKGRQFYKGPWQYQGMTGYTGQGLGPVSIPVRFNTFSEIALIRLLKEGSGKEPLAL